MAHDHSAAQRHSGRLAFVLALTAAFFVVEVVGAAITGSLALLSDAGHLLIDSAGLAIALLAIKFGQRTPTLDKSYGYYRLEILAALLNGFLMVLIGAFILVEAAQRFADPPEIAGLQVVAFAAPGLLVNLIAGLLLMEGQKSSLNLRGAFLEVISDLAASLAVILSGIVIYLTGFKLIDPIASIGIGVFILPRTWQLLSEAAHVLLEGSPRGINTTHIREHIFDVDGVVGIHDLHVWNLTSGMAVMSAHVVVEAGANPAGVLDAISSCLEGHFEIEHVTIQIEQGDRSNLEHSAH